MRTFMIQLVMLWTLAGCGASYQMQYPESFAVLQDQTDYTERATTADGVVVSVRELPNEPKAGAAFWRKALLNQVRLKGGYALIEEKDVRTKSGESGTQMRFGHDEERKPYQYWLTLFVTDAYVYVIEAGGKASEFAEVQAEVEETLGSFTIR